MNVFISRPTWVQKEYQTSIDLFIKFLEREGIEPHTLGSTDFPVESPLDEVITLMEAASGVIVLGYPQIKIEKGKIKGKYIENIQLPTEWNHIEAVLAYSLKLPLLIIHDKGISRGIFDRGAINKFIHEVDLEKPDWYESDAIKGALKNWKNKIETTPEFYETYTLYESKEIDLKDYEMNLLLKASEDKDGSILKIGSKDGLEISANRKVFIENGRGRERAKWENSINKLKNLGLIKSININETIYHLTEKGYEFVEERNPLKWIPEIMIQTMKETKNLNQPYFIYEMRANGKILSSGKEIKESGILGERKAYWDYIINKMVDNDLIKEVGNGRYQLEMNGYNLIKD